MNWKEMPCSEESIRLEATDQVGTLHSVLYHHGLKCICLVIENNKSIILFDKTTSKKVFEKYVDFPEDLKKKLVDFEKLLKIKQVVDCL